MLKGKGPGARKIISIVQGRYWTEGPRVQRIMNQHDTVVPPSRLYVVLRQKISTENIKAKALCKKKAFPFKNYTKVKIREFL